MDNKPQYKKASRRASSLFSRSQLWYGSDHLLLVKEFGASEEYKRFYYRDIQTMIALRTPAYYLWGIVFLVMILFLLGAYFGAEEVDGVAALFGLGFITLFLGAHLLRGPTCKCWIQTRINKEKLIMFGRTAQVRRFLTQVEPKIVAVQGRFSLDEMKSIGHHPIPDSNPIPPLPAAL